MRRHHLREQEKSTGLGELTQRICKEKSSRPGFDLGQGAPQPFSTRLGSKTQRRQQQQPGSSAHQHALESLAVPRAG